MKRKRIVWIGAALIVIAAILANAPGRTGSDDDLDSAQSVPGESAGAATEAENTETEAETTETEPEATDAAQTEATEPELEILDQSALGDTSAISYLKGRTETGAVVEIIDGVTYVDGYLLVNKTYSLPADYVPEGTKAALDGVQKSNEGLVLEAWEAWQQLQAAAAAEGLSIYISSGYRSYSYQGMLWSNYVARDGQAAADTYSARAGHSEHQTGYCFDLNSISSAFTNTAEGIWVNENCCRYGFIIRYPEGKSDQTGYKYESWHLRYVGQELAQTLYNGGDWITMEEYFGLASVYAAD
ncbi:MAG: M15 family metallopeptidase [Firmicutes bacterium]|nr:M15 family metallopeptidase [Bacillota bacterium]